MDATNDSSGTHHFQLLMASMHHTKLTISLDVIYAIG